MNCRRIETLLFHPYDRQLSPREADALDRHMAECSACRRLVADLHENQAALSALAAGRHAAGITHAAIAQWERERDARPSGQRPGLPRRALTLCVALSLALVMLALDISRSIRENEARRSPQSLSPGSPTAPGLPLSADYHHLRVAEGGTKRAARQGSLPYPPWTGGAATFHKTAPRKQGVRAARQGSPPKRAGVGQERDWASGASTTEWSSHADEPSGPPRRVPRLPGGDLAYLNAGPAGITAASIQKEDRMIASLQKTVDRMIRSGDDFVSVPFPPLAAMSEKGVRAAIAAYRQEKEVVDLRLARKVTVAAKGMALADLCKRLHDDV